MPFTILHVSDLHRAHDDPISNDELVSTIVADCDRFGREAPAVPRPDAIVVSGDLVQGVPLAAPEHAVTIVGQYEVAIGFISELADRLLEGDRSRVAIVPGNHDVDWNVAHSAMQPVPMHDLSGKFGPELCGPLGDLRLDWRELQPYRITDHTTYDRRLAHYRDAVAGFYAGTNVEETDLFRLHSWMDGAIGVACFDSCVGNDCFAHYGAIREEAIARAHLALRDRGHQLHMAVWHHSVHGDPVAGDYMALEHLYRLIDRGFRVGFHGHQHRAAIESRHAHGLGDERMAVISAGSLCAGRRELPVGTNRQYNIVEMADHLQSLRVHIREMAIATNFAAARRAEFGGRSYVDLAWDAPAPSVVPGPEIAHDRSVLAAEEALARGEPERALRALAEVPAEPGSYARTLLLRALQDQGDDGELARLFANPVNSDELVAASLAILAVRGEHEALKFLEVSGAAIDLPKPQADDLRLVITTRARLQ